MTRIVITGATGFIGSNLASLYLRQGYEVFALVRPESQSWTVLPPSGRQRDFSIWPGVV